MKRRTVLALVSVFMLTIAACSDSSDDTQALITTTDSPGGPEFAITAVSFSEGFVEITNIGDAQGGVDGWFLCQRPSYHAIGLLDLAPGESIQIAASGASYGSLDPGSGEIGLYAGNSFGDADAIVSYVEWGDSGHGRSGTAVEAGIWTDGGFVATDGSTGTLTSDGTATSPDGWSAG